MPQLRSVTEWTTREGRVRRIRLYMSWRNLNSRIQGHVTTGRGGLPIWAGLECDFKDWADFRTWALANGYSRIRCSLDRERSQFGYIKTNLRWVTPLQNSTYANLVGSRKRRQLARQATVDAFETGCL
jgi:hypothetical protein